MRLLAWARPAAPLPGALKWKEEVAWSSSCSRNAHDKWEGRPRWPCALGTEEGMEADDLLCSRNARPQKALVGRAQWKINQPPSLKRQQARLERSFIPFDARNRGSTRPHPGKTHEQAWRKPKSKASWSI
jgi:hypothetical protein